MSVVRYRIPSQEVLDEIKRRMCISEDNKLVYNFDIKNSYPKKFKGDEVGVHRPDGYRNFQVLKVKLLNHRAIFFLRKGYWPKGEIDHINGDRSDNRIENLRDVPNSINSRNKKIHPDNISGLSGVTWEKTKECWRVRINKNIDIKRTPDFFEACCARKSAENSLAYHENHGRSK